MRACSLHEDIFLITVILAEYPTQARGKRQYPFSISTDEGIKALSSEAERHLPHERGFIVITSISG